MPSPTAEMLGSCCPPREPHETSSITEATGPPMKGARGYLGPLFSEPSRHTEGLGLIFLLKPMDATITALRGKISKVRRQQPGPVSVRGPRSVGRPRVGPAAPPSSHC